MSPREDSARLTVEIEARARPLCAQAAPVPDFVWKGPCRQPPLPYYQKSMRRPGFCRVCGGPTVSSRTLWHADCTAAYWQWKTPHHWVVELKNGHRCARCPETKFLEI